MNFRQLCTLMQERHASGVSMQKLAEEYRISKPAVGRIIAGKKPGKKICAILHIGRSPEQIAASQAYTRMRQSALDARARDFGWDCLSDCLTAVLHGQAELPEKER